MGTEGCTLRGSAEREWMLWGLWGEETHRKDLFRSPLSFVCELLEAWDYLRLFFVSLIVRTVPDTYSRCLINV